ncbi:MAG: hypothetical protein PVF17_04135 [Ignavibacteria bacterium]|jgi:outer membrane lipoprotein-sorting protein
MELFKSTFRDRLSILIALLFLSSANLHAQGELQEELEKFGFESARGKKNITTDMMGVKTENSQEFFIARHGDLMAIYQTEKRIISMADIEEVEKRVIINDGPWIITYDPETRKGTKMKIDVAGKLSGMSKDDMMKMAEGLKDATNTETENLGTREIAGQICTGIKATTNMMGMESVSEIWTFKNYVMESITTGTANVVEKVIEFILGSNYDPEKLKVPSDVTLEEIQSPF